MVELTEADEAMVEAFGDFLRAAGVPADGSPVKDREAALEALDRMEWIGGGDHGEGRRGPDQGGG